MQWEYISTTILGDFCEEISILAMGSTVMLRTVRKRIHESGKPDHSTEKVDVQVLKNMYVDRSHGKVSIKPLQERVELSPVDSSRQTKRDLYPPLRELQAGDHILCFHSKSYPGVPNRPQGAWGEICLDGNPIHPQDLVVRWLDDPEHKECWLNQIITSHTYYDESCVQLIRRRKSVWTKT